MNAYSTTTRDLAAAILGKPLVDVRPEPTVADLIAFVKSHPANPYPNIRWGMSLLTCDETETLAALKRRLGFQLPLWKQQVIAKSWTANPTKVSVACMVLDLIDEFEMTEPRAA